MLRLSVLLSVVAMSLLGCHRFDLYLISNFFPVGQLSVANFRIAYTRCYLNVNRKMLDWDCCNLSFHEHRRKFYAIEVLKFVDHDKEELFLQI